MGSSSSIMRPQELVEFRKLNTSIENVELPARPESRTLTDKKGFLIFGIGILILLPFLIYTLANSDMRIFTYPYDDCGNFCGYNNQQIEGLYCSGKDHTNTPYLNGYSCANSCPINQIIIRGTCLNKTSVIKTSRGEYEPKSDGTHPEIRAGLEVSQREWWKYLLTIIITIALSILTIVMLRYAPSPLVWAIIIFTMVIVLVITGLLWFIYITLLNDQSRDFAGVASILLGPIIVWTVLALIVIIVFIVLFKKIGLVVQLYKETTKVLAAMPLLVFIPVLITVIQFILLLALAFTTFGMIFSQELYKVETFGPVKYTYGLTGVAIFTIIFNFVVASWAMRFIAGIQYMIISGCVSTWYFAKNKKYLNSPICTNFKITMKYHLGTIAFGSFLMTLFWVVKAVIRALCRNVCCRCCVVTCCSSVEVVLKFLSENAYIETALHGQSYLRSAKRATKLLLTNAASVIAISCVGDFVLGLIILMVTLIATGISYALFMSNGLGATLPTVICAIVNLIIVCITFATFQTIIDTLFICFCEDSIINDGVTKPFYMSRGLMEFVDNSKKVYGKKGQYN